MDYKIVKKGEMRIVGVKMSLDKNVEENFKEVPKFWGEVGASGKLNEVISLMDESSKGVLGVSVCLDDMENWEYYIAVETNKEAKEGMDEYVIKPCTWAVFPGKGKMPESIQETERKIFTEWLPASSYEYKNEADIELYLNQDQVNSEFEVWLPIKEK